MKSVQDTSANWTGSSGRATTAYEAGVQATTKDQAALAVAAESRMQQGFNDAVSSGRWRAGVTRGGTPYWKQQTIAKKANFGTGFTAGAQNYAAAAAKFMPAIATGVAGLAPRGDINQNLDRSRSLALYLHGLKGQLGARS